MKYKENNFFIFYLILYTRLDIFLLFVCYSVDNFCFITLSAFWMCKHGLLKILETNNISVQEVKFSQLIQQLLVIHIDVHSEQKVTHFFFPQCFSKNRRIVYSQRYSNLLNFRLGDAL